MRVDYGHEEVLRVYGKDPREYAILSKEFIGDCDGKVTGIKTVKVEWHKDAATNQWKMNEVVGSDRVYKADLVLLAMGFMGSENAMGPAHAASPPLRPIVSLRPDEDEEVESAAFVV